VLQGWCFVSLRNGRGEEEELLLELCWSQAVTHNPKASCKHAALHRRGVLILNPLNPLTLFLSLSPPPLPSLGSSHLLQYGKFTCIAVSFHPMPSSCCFPSRSSMVWLWGAVVKYVISGVLDSSRFVTAGEGRAA